jgi:putative ATPase
MNYKRPLAYRARPTSFKDIVGQPHLLGTKGVIRKMIEQGRLFSLILYGPPGVGKTTIASVIGEAFGLRTFTFNASTDNKATLKEIIEGAKHYGALLIVDEIHRMNKAIQDYLLPHVEKGTVVMIGLTTNNPYHSVNPAVRSRVHVLKLKPLEKNDIIARLKQIETQFIKELTGSLEDDVYEYIAVSASGEIRSAINMLELLHLAYPNEAINIEKAESLLLQPNLALDKNEDNYYNTLSAFQKSIRGSDVDAALHYLGRLIEMEDLDSILRRMTVIAFEDIGLANPNIVSRMHATASACERLGFPEARIPLGFMVIDLALSPKSNTAESSIDAALEDIHNGLTPKIPNHIINVSNFESKTPYLYPHDYEGGVICQQYLPDELKDKQYYKAKETGKYERALKARNEWLKTVLKN